MFVHGIAAEYNTSEELLSLQAMYGTAKGEDVIEKLFWLKPVVSSIIIIWYNTFWHQTPCRRESSVFKIEIAFDWKKVPHSCIIQLLMVSMECMKQSLLLSDWLSSGYSETIKIHSTVLPAGCHCLSHLRQCSWVICRVICWELPATDVSPL